MCSINTKSLCCYSKYVLIIIGVTHDPTVYRVLRLIHSLLLGLKETLVKILKRRKTIRPLVCVKRNVVTRSCIVCRHTIWTLLLSLSMFHQNIKIHNINLSTNFHICVACIETNGLCDDFDNWTAGSAWENTNAFGTTESYSDCRLPVAVWVASSTGQGSWEEILRISCMWALVVKKKKISLKYT